MSTGLRLHLQASSGETMPAKVEIFDVTLRPVAQRWLSASESRVFPLESGGFYGVRATVASGAMVEQAVEVRPGETVDCYLPLYTASPHESHEWAYFTKPIDAPGRKSLSETRYEGVWMRLWERNEPGAWRVLPPPVHDVSQGSWEEDGVSYRFEAPGQQAYALQVGGPRVPWKIAALPPTRHVMVLVRPASAPTGATHPLDVVVSSDDWKMETLLGLMQRGDTAEARDLDEEKRIAEEQLYGKVRNTAGAAVGGYFLLQAGDLRRLHDWANNLANWFEWMPDGPVIHAWQCIAEARRDANKAASLLDQARGRLLEAVRRGFPLYTVGLRLLRDGLLLFDRNARGKNEDIRNALDRIGAYAAAADWSAVTTTFTGEHPEKPSGTSRCGAPSDSDPLLYVFDVPLGEAIRQGALQPGERLQVERPDGDWRCEVGENGTLSLPGYPDFKSLGAMHEALTGDAKGAWASWKVASTGEYLGSVVKGLRTHP